MGDVENLLRQLSLQLKVTATPGFELIDLEKLLGLLVSAAFVAGFALVVLNVSQVAFSRSATETAPLGGGPPVTIWTSTGVLADAIRDHILFLVYAFSLLIGFYVAAFAVGLFAETFLQSTKAVAAESERLRSISACYGGRYSFVVCHTGDLVRPYIEDIRWAAGRLVFKTETLQFFFACLWLGMIWAIMSILRCRMRLT